MKRILPYSLWIGNIAEARDWATLSSLEIDTIVELAIEEPPLAPPREWVSLRLPLLDGAGNSDSVLRMAVNSLATFIAHGRPTLVCCSAGMSRSPAIAAFALYKLTGQSPQVCLQAIEALGPCDVSPGLWNDLVRLAVYE